MIRKKIRRPLFPSPRSNKLTIPRNKQIPKKKVVFMSPPITSTESLGGGFQRHTFDFVNIPANDYAEIRLSVRNTTRKPISAGWRLYDFHQAYAVDSYPRTTTEWTLTIYNATNIERAITPYLITKP